MPRYDFPDLDYYCERKKFPIYTEYRTEQVKLDLDYKPLSEGEKQKLLQSEVAKLEEFYEIVSTGKNHREAEEIIYPESKQFYKEYIKQMEKLEQLQKLEQQEAKLKQSKLKTKTALDQPLGSLNFYLEKGLSKAQRDLLLSEDFTRLKVSPFGNSGSAFYWVKKRWNESKEHAFFCYLIESEVKKHVEKVELDANSGGDVVFEANGEKYCFDVETGGNLARNPKYVVDKYAKYSKLYDEMYIFITDKKLKYKYSKFGKVITRAKLRETIDKILNK